jgi:hypothetical protein
MKPIPLNRRHFLYGTGVSMLLPHLESLAGAAGPAGASGKDTPKRFLAAYVGHGFAITRQDDHPARDWSWYPQLIDGKMKFGKSTASFQALEKQISIFYGLDHPQVVVSNGHSSADSFLTASNPQASVISPSVDQVAALTHGKKTRFASLVLGNEGGLGIRGGSHTLSYNRSGRAIPSVNDLQLLYNRLFNSDPAIMRSEQALFQRNGTLVDRVMASAKDLKRRVSADDNRKIESYLESVRGVEKNIARMQLWSETPKPSVDITDLSLKATVNEPALFIETMYNLIYLAFKTDSTRYATYMLQSMAGGIWDSMPKNALGLGANHHLLAHQAAGTKLKAMEKLGTFDKFQADLLAKFLHRLADTPEGEGSMLDNTLVLFGCSNSKTHVNRDYPLMLAGGRNLGIRQGVFHEMADSGVPFSNLLLTCLQQLDVPAKNFSDSTGIVEEILA